MIRLATKYDKTEIIEMMKSFRKEVSLFEDFENIEYWNRLLDSILAGQGVIYIKEQIGLIMGIITPSIWDDKVLVMHELAWYVKPEFRNGLTGYKLLKAYIDHCNGLKQEGRIKMFAIARLQSSPDFDYSRFGFTKLDESWIQ